MSGGSRSALAFGDRCAGGATDFVIDDANLYWVASTTSPNAHVIMKVPIGGGPSTPLVTATDFREITGLAGDATYVYWEDDADTNRVLRIPKTGGAVDTIATIADGFRSFRGGLVVDGTDVFFGDTDFFDEHRVMKVSVSGGAVTVLADITGIDQNAVNTPRRFRVESPTVYWIDAQAIHGVPMDSGAITTPESGLASPVDFVVTATDLVWIESVCVRTARLAGSEGPGRGGRGHHDLRQSRRAHRARRRRIHRVLDRGRPHRSHRRVRANRAGTHQRRDGDDGRGGSSGSRSRSTPRTSTSGTRSPSRRSPRAGERSSGWPSATSTFRPSRPTAPTSTGPKVAGRRCDGYR